MELTITSVDLAPDDLYDQVPFVVDLIRQIPGDDRDDYWVGALRKPIRWMKNDHPREVTHVLLVARWEGTSIDITAQDLPVGIAYVTDSALLEEQRLDLAKCEYITIGLSTATGSDAYPQPLPGFLAGIVAPAFTKR